jgi:hypothetical protein
VTAREQAALLDRTGTLTLEGLEVEVIVQDVRTRFGTVDVLVSPTQGRGQKWVTLDRVRLIG